MAKLQIDEKEALELWEFDKEETENEIVNDIEKKIESEKPKAPSKIGKVLNMKMKKKIDEEKETLTKMLLETLNTSNLVLYPQEMTTTKITFVTDTKTYYTVALTKHKTKPDGYREEKKDDSTTLRLAETESI